MSDELLLEYSQLGIDLQYKLIHLNNELVLRAYLTSQLLNYNLVSLRPLHNVSNVLLQRLFCL